MLNVPPLRIEDVDGSWDILTVWAETPEAAVNFANEWIDAPDRRPA